MEGLTAVCKNGYSHQFQRRELEAVPVLRCTYAVVGLRESRLMRRGLTRRDENRCTARARLDGRVQERGQTPIPKAGIGISPRFAVYVCSGGIYERVGHEAGAHSTG